MQTIEHWREWKERCALGLCRKETQSALQAFAHARFCRFAAVYAGSTNTRDPFALAPEPGAAWHGFETHLRLHDTREGKRFKNWLFAPLNGNDLPTLDSIHRGATVIVRDVVREHLRREFSSRIVLSLDAPMGGTAGEPCPTLQELLAAPHTTTQDVEERDLNRLALRESASAMAGLNRRERIALLARELGLSLAHPGVIRAAGCGKSVLNTAFHDALLQLASHARSAHPGEDKATLASLTILIFQHVKHRILLWGKSEKGAAQLCILVDEHTSR